MTKEEIKKGDKSASIIYVIFLTILTTLAVLVSWGDMYRLRVSVVFFALLFIFGIARSEYLYRKIKGE